MTKGQFMIAIGEATSLFKMLGSGTWEYAQEQARTMGILIGDASLQPEHHPVVRAIYIVGSFPHHSLGEHMGHIELAWDHYEKATRTQSATTGS